MKIKIERLGETATIEDLVVKSEFTELKKELEDIIFFNKDHENANLSKMQIIANELILINLYDLEFFGFDNDIEGKIL